MKVGIITLTSGGFNFGNSLQIYALNKYLRNMGIEAETILDMRSYSWHKGFNWIDYFKSRSFKGIVALLINYQNVRDSFKNNYVRIPAYVSFNGNIKFSEHNFMNTPMNEIDDMYDFFIVGSDQVWNPYFGCLDIGFLDFACKSKRISYAASFGVSEIPSNMSKLYIEGLKNMKYISVREQAGANIVKNLIGKDVPVLIDPTLLLDKEDWMDVAKKPNWYTGEKYILTYFLGEKPAGVNDELQRLSTKYDLKIIDLLDTSKREWYAIGPGEFVYLINHCALMYTDSFHGTVFSILFEVPFVLCERLQKNGKSMTSRIDSLLGLFGLQFRRGTYENNFKIENPMEIKYSNMEDILFFERKRSEEYLKNALKID